jgi:phenylacetate-CoA ligase
LIIVAGEAGGSVPGVRSALERAWPGARIFDHHGMTETGPVTHEDPAHPGRLIILERSFLAEVIDPATAQPVPEGTEGELVLTTLRRRACPLLRYRTGDLVRAVRVPAGLALEGGILGRLDDMVVVRGVNVYPSAIETLVRQFPEIGEFRVTLDRSGAMTELRLEIEGSESTASALHDRIRSSLALRVPVTPVPPGTLPRFEMKARRWVEKR